MDFQEWVEEEREAKCNGPIVRNKFAKLRNMILRLNKTHTWADTINSCGPHVEFIKSEVWFWAPWKVAVRASMLQDVPFSLSLREMLESFRGLCSPCLPHREVWPHLALCFGLA